MYITVHSVPLLDDYLPHRTSCESKCPSIILPAAMSCFIAGGAPCTPWYYVPTRTHLSVAPLHAGDHPHGTIDNSYIVAFREDVFPALMGNYLNFLQMARASDSLRGDTVVDSLRHVCEGGLERYVGKFTEGVVGQIPRMPEVNLAEKNQVVRATFFNGVRCG